MDEVEKKGPNGCVIALLVVLALLLGGPVLCFVCYMLLLVGISVVTLGTGSILFFDQLLSQPFDWQLVLVPVLGMALVLICPFVALLVLLVRALRGNFRGKGNGVYVVLLLLMLLGVVLLINSPWHQLVGETISAPSSLPNIDTLTDDEYLLETIDSLDWIEAP